jgi:hypothetical protein
MKVIAHVGDDRILVELHRDEAANLVGASYASSLEDVHGPYSRERKFPIGYELKVSDIYWRLKYQEGVAGQLEVAAKNLRSLADLIETVKPAAEQLTKHPEGGAS